MGTNERSTADILYGGSTPSSAPPTTVTSPPRTPASTEENSDADVLFAAPPRHPVKAGERLSDAAVLFPAEVALRPAFRAQAATWHDVHGLTPEQQAAEGAAMTEDLVERVGLDPYVAAPLIEPLVQVGVEDRRGVEEPDEATIQAWEEASRRSLREEYGLERGDRVFQATRDHVAQTAPRLHDVLGRRGLGSRPDIVLPLCEHVRKLKHL